MTLIDVLDFLEEKVDCPNWYAGKRSDTAEKSITVYPTDGVAPVLPLGGVESGILRHQGGFRVCPLGQKCDSRGSKGPGDLRLSLWSGRDNRQKRCYQVRYADRGTGRHWNGR